MIRFNRKQSQFQVGRMIYGSMNNNEKYLEQKTVITSSCTDLIPIAKEKSFPIKANEIALARLDLIRE